MAPTRFSCLLLLALAPAVSAADPDFDRTIAPLLVQHCLDCHQGPKPKGGLDLSRQQAALAGGKSGVAIVPGRAEESRLWRRVHAGEMPPKKPLPEAEKALLQAWLAAGAPWGSDPIDPFRFTSDRRAGYDWWALQPVVRPELPAVKNPSWTRNPIDVFVLAQLEARGLAPSPEADRRTLIRRLSFDLLGLPPSPEEVAAFVQDEAPDAYSKLADRYLQSPQYGVRWARHWLDVVRFGESNGFEYDEFRANAWPYRDWVVGALNRDLPYDKFVRLQLAGDVLQPNQADGIAATGFLVAGAYDTAGQGQQSPIMKRVVRQDELEDIVGTVGQTFLGLTVNCARCHDHKFDPVKQVEYYRLTAALGGVRHGERPLPGREPRKAYAVTPRPAEPAHLLVRGNPEQPGEAVAAGGIAALASLKADFGLASDAQEGERRTRLADWITDPKNPLCGRVMVNRLWHYHFGAGLVETPNDFGFNGTRPTHPQLLDWLAAELVERNWSLKELHRTIVTAATYRQSSRPNAAALRVDAGNRLLWRKSPLRLEAEMVRDATLSIAGRLHATLGGPSFQDFQLTRAPGTPAMIYTPTDTDDADHSRRTLYRAWTRGARGGLLDALDCPDPSTTTPNRAVTTTPLQALALLNNALVLRQAAHFAERLQREAGADVGQQIARAYWLAYSRPPRDDERAAAERVVQEHGLAALTRAILNSNEFLYVD
jgi:hypothetical protein